MPEPLTVTEDQVRALRAALDALLPDERITQLTDERDRARRRAVGLEQENAELTRRLAEVETETHIVADDSADPEHVDDCPGCRPRRAAAETDPDRELLRRASDDSSDWDDATWAAWWRITERAHARSTTCTCGTPGGDS